MNQINDMFIETAKSYGHLVGFSQDGFHFTDEQGTRIEVKPLLMGQIRITEEGIEYNSDGFSRYGMKHPISGREIP